jgi:hypothetical protein
MFSNASKSLSARWPKHVGHPAGSVRTGKRVKSLAGYGRA